MKIPVLFLLLIAMPGSRMQAQASPAVAQVLGPALDTLTRDLGKLDPNRWKLNAPLRDQSAADLRSIAHDLDATLPPLITASDATKNSPAAMLPVSRNVTALYDVLVRLVERARNAPADQQAALEEARSSLDAARRTFDQQLQAYAETEATTLKQTPPPPPACPAPATPVKKAKSKAKPAA